MRTGVRNRGGLRPPSRRIAGGILPLRRASYLEAHGGPPGAVPRAAALVLPGTDWWLHQTSVQTNLWHGTGGLADERDDLRPKILRGEFRGAPRSKASKAPAAPPAGCWQTVRAAEDGTEETPGEGSNPSGEMKMPFFSPARQGAPSPTPADTTTATSVQLHSHGHTRWSHGACRDTEPKGLGDGYPYQTAHRGEACHERHPEAA